MQSSAMQPTAILFPGQGAQSLGMGRDLCTQSPAANQLFERASTLLAFDLKEVCFEGPVERLNSTECSQPALFVASLAAAELLEEQAPGALSACRYMAGLSLGEYTALVFAGAIDFEAGLQLVAERGRAMQAASDAVASGMVSVLGLKLDQVERLCDAAREQDVLQIANNLCPGNIAVSGHAAACDRLVPLAEQAGAMKVIPLAVAGAFHTSLMQPAVERLSAALDDTEIREPRVPVVSNVDARPHTDPAEIRELLRRQVISPVRWEESMQWLLAEEITQFYEIGPGRVLRGLLRRINRKIACTNIPA